jgi:hypothetical protein
MCARWLLGGLYSSPTSERLVGGPAHCGLAVGACSVRASESVALRGDTDWLVVNVHTGRQGGTVSSGGSPRMGE